MDKEHLIFGTRAVIEAIDAAKSIDRIFIQKGSNSQLLKSLIEAADRHRVSYTHVPVEKLNRMVSGVHQGVVAVTSPVVFQNLETVLEQQLKTTSPPLVLLLDHISDVRNFGAIIRTAECAGVTAIVVQDSGGAPVNGDTIKASAGAVFKVPLCKVAHLKDAVFYLQSIGITIVAATEKTDKTLYDVPFLEGVAIILGAEDVGISPSLLKAADIKAKLPMLGTISSLNVSVAGALFLYEALRQRNFTNASKN